MFTFQIKIKLLFPWKDYNSKILKIRVCYIARLARPRALASSRLCTLPIINTRFTRLRAYTFLPSSIGSLRALRAFVLCCVVLLQFEMKVCFVCALQLNIHPRLSLLSFSLPYKAVLYAFFSFVYFKPLVTTLFVKLFCNNVFVILKNEGADLIKTV